ncbi:hypothetical protein HDU85_003426 [Gaertneriomyces sp. JEL0708]|nr:hypothetical protein HDU85_003426 [Gaertneriomyces sp. JEL0708]
MRKLKRIHQKGEQVDRCYGSKSVGNSGKTADYIKRKGSRKTKIDDVRTMTKTPTSRNQSTPVKYVRKVLKAQRASPAVNFYKYFHCSDRSAAEAMLKEALTELASTATGKVKAGVEKCLARWEKSVGDGNAVVGAYWHK